MAKTFIGSLLSILKCNSRIQHIEISLTDPANDGTNWLSFIWNRDSDLLKEKYGNERYKIDYIEKDESKYQPDTISIDRL